VEPEEDTVWDGEMGRFVAGVPCRWCILCSCRMAATTENTPDIIRAFSSMAVLCGVITCAFDAS
jgi:hypothetical protein